MNDRMDREKFKALSFWQKVQWVFQYYGVAMLVTALVLFVGVVFVRSVLGPGDEYALRVLILDDRMSVDKCQVFGADLEALLGGACDVTSYQPSDTYGMQAFVVRLTTDPLDLVIAPEEQMQQLADNGYVTAALKLDEQSWYMQAAGAGDGHEQPCYIGRTATAAAGETISAAEEYFIQPPGGS